MSYQRVISPSNGGGYLFDGGLNTKFEKSIIGDNESPSCQNVQFSNGAVATRQGVTKLNTTAIGTFIGDGIYTRHTNTGGQTMIVFAGGSAWQLAGTTFSTIPSAQSVFTAGIRVAAAEYQQHLFIGNGGVIPYKYNGTDFTRMGVYPPTTTMVVASQAVGVLTGDYRYKLTWVNSQSVESDVGPVTVTFTAAGATLRVSTIPVAPQSYGISTRRLYRNTTAASGTYKLVTTLNDNTTTTYDDNNTDASLGAVAPTDHGVPPKFSVIVYHRDRLFVNDPSNPNFVWYSDLEEPYTWPAANFRLFGDNTKNIVRALAVDSENLVIFGDDAIELIYMPSPDDSEWVNVKVKADFGCKSPYGIIKYNNGLLFPAVQNGKFIGFANLVGDVIAPTATLLTVSTAGSDLVSDKIQPDILAFSNSDIGRLSGIVDNNIGYFAVPSSTSSTENDKIYIFDFSISNVAKNIPYAWAPWTGLYACQFTKFSNSIYYIESRALGFVRKLNSGVYNDDGSAIDSYFYSKEYGGNEADFSFWKDFRFSNVLVDLAGNYQMNFTARVDSDMGSGNTQVISLDPGGSLWGTMTWAVDSWGGGSSQEEFRMDLGTISGKRIQFKFDNQNTKDQRFKVHRLNFLSNVKGLR